MLMSLTTLRSVGSPDGADVLSELKNNPPSLTLEGESIRGMITAAQISESHFISACLTFQSLEKVAFAHLFSEVL